MEDRQTCRWFDFYKGKTVLVTGHTGFKGSWLCVMLQMAGANVIGYALGPNSQENLFDLANVESGIKSVIGDIRDLNLLKETFLRYQPEIVFHLAAQPIVREGYKNPVYTYETNVMGTVNVLECIRSTQCVKSFLNITTDKVYNNREWEWGYRETDTLDGFDPYSNSKSCSELVTHSYYNSFLKEQKVAVSTARAGNVIGGGDFAKDRIIPDCIRAALQKQKVIIRNPYAVRPFQHVLEPLCAYMQIAAYQTVQVDKQGCYNVGPEEVDCVTVGTLADLFCEIWGDNIAWENVCDNGPHEAGYLKLDCSRIKQQIGWKSTWNIRTAIEKTIELTRVYEKKGDVRKCMEKQIADFLIKA